MNGRPRYNKANRTNLKWHYEVYFGEPADKTPSKALKGFYLLQLYRKTIKKEEDQLLSTEDNLFTIGTNILFREFIGRS